MGRPLSMSEKLMYATVRIECLEAGQVVSTGTGFFFNFLEKEDNTHCPTIVTNKHVIKGAQSGRFIMTLADSNNHPTDQRLTCNLDDFENSWIMHPEENVDLCILPIAEILNGLVDHGRAATRTALNREALPGKDVLKSLGAIEDIVMVGYPNGLWDSVNNLPILRKGITATHPNRDYNGSKEFLIDAACYPGSSGSPVFLYNDGMYSDGLGNVTVGSRLFLLGILYAGLQFTARGDIHVVNIPTSNKEVILSKIPINLGVIIKAEKLLDFEDILIKRKQNLIKGKE